MQKRFTCCACGILLWSNPDDVVLSHFMGIGSEGFCAVQMRRKFVGAELKTSYFNQAAKNLAGAIRHQETGLFADAEAA